MSLPAIHLVSAANERFFPGLLTSLGTAIGSASGRFDYRVTVIDSGIPDAFWSQLAGCLARIAKLRGISVELRRLVPDTRAFDAFPDRRGSPLTYARLAIPHLLSDEFFVYIDSDVVCFRGVEDFWEGLTPQVAITAARDPLGCIRRDRSARKDLPGRFSESSYFNAGIIGINAGIWREKRISARMGELIKRVKSFRYVDQTLLNILFLNQWREVSPYNNFVLTLERCSEIHSLPEPANFHFVGPRKPWFSSRSSFYRIVPDQLFDIALQWVNGGELSDVREVVCGSMVKAKRKALIYGMLGMRRGRVYRQAIQTCAECLPVSGKIWQNHGADSWESRSRGFA